MRLIDADNIKYTDMLAPMGNGNYEHVGIVTKPEIEALPTVDAAPVIHGKWERVHMWTGAETIFCSVCGEDCYVSDTDDDILSPYCPNCGARMDDND